MSGVQRVASDPEVRVRAHGAQGRTGDRGHRRHDRSRSRVRSRSTRMQGRRDEDIRRRGCLNPTRRTPSVSRISCRPRTSHSEARRKSWWAKCCTLRPKKPASARQVSAATSTIPSMGPLESNHGSGRASITSPSVGKSRTHGSPRYLHTISRKSDERSNVQFGTASKGTTRISGSKQLVRDRLAPRGISAIRTGAATADAG